MINHIYWKEIKDAFRDRKTIFLSVIIPILFSIGLVFFMDNFFLKDETSEIMDVAVHEQMDAEVVDWVKSDEQIEVFETDDPALAIEEGDALVGIETDDQFISLLEEGQSPQIHLYSDSASMKGSQATETISSLLTLKQNEITTELLSESDVSPTIMEPFTLETSSITGEEDGKYMISILAQLIIVLAVLLGGLPAATDLFAGEKERKTMEALIMTPVKRIHILVGKWLTIATLGIISGVFSVITLVTFIQLFTENLKEALSLSDNLMFFVLSLCIGIVAFALLVAALLMVLSLLAKNMKEAQNYVQPVMMMAMIPYFVLISVSPHELTNVYFVIPFMNIYALIKQLIYGVYDISSIVLVTGSSLVFIAITFIIGVGMFTKSKWVLGDS